LNGASGVNGVAEARIVELESNIVDMGVLVDLLRPSYIGAAGSVLDVTDDVAFV
jgi:hypothetical protein